MPNRIYLDHAATTPLARSVFDKMKPFFGTAFGNPSSIYTEGQIARAAVDEARALAAGIFAVTPGEVIFTSGGTEADHLAIAGAADAFLAKNAKPGKILVSAVEHPAVLETAEILEKRRGFEVKKLPVDEFGRVDPEVLQKNLDETVAVVSIMAANNEIGTTNDLRALAKVIADFRGDGKFPVFHSDAVQAAGIFDLRMPALGPDAVSISAHKFYGPKGVGALIARRGVPILRQIPGSQESSRRGGTTNVAGIVGLGAALARAYFGENGEILPADSPDFFKNRAAENARIAALRDSLREKILAAVPEIRVNGHPTDRLPGNLHISVGRIEGEAMLLRLDFAGIAASSGSACTSGSLDPSHVLMAIGLDHATAHGSLRLTLGEKTTPAEIDATVEALQKTAEVLREMTTE